ncbi:endonuclease domain-containing protein [Novosphingobium album (ex Liu et al. 2023)]|uniref:Endonuclease domain-containing protein n=1 Tax=Novosphingobium album (ex Liu et al. 2023) TaxID=3031130 RepID=A0ABT5WVV6_9SPHN|nr:endonuclease domain-containing protein [Novosphingobium album (ex Liu et al. 2023)]MDE8654013.1 endonuclease domain-containing protein [Novosphingobium album (ex Liu et al. 2023)]
MFRDVSPKPRDGRIDRARKLRRAMSLPEGLLWRELRQRPHGLKFRRQHPSGAYVLDFYCSDARLAIEVDGAAHDFGDRPLRDEVRDAWFARAGIATLRIPAKAVLDDLERVLALILAEAAARLPLHHPAAPGGPPPRDELGEE